MNVAELMEQLSKLDPSLTVEIGSQDGWDSREVDAVHVETVKRGGGLPEPQAYQVVMLSGAWDGI